MDRLTAAARGRYVVPLALLGAYCLSRLVNLGLLPMVSDEGTYITWGVRALHATTAEEWLASLEDGKQPLLAWLMPPFLALVPDRLVAGRLVSVLIGLLNLALLVAVGRRLFDDTTALVGAALYVVAPIAFIHDRMALYDSLVTAGSLLVLWAALAWAERPSWRRTAGLGLAMGLALLTKLSALFFLALVPVVVALWRPGGLRRWWTLAQAYFIAAAVYSVLYLSPIVGNIQDGNFQRYSLTLGEVLQLPWATWWRNVVFVAEAAVVYLGWPLALLTVAGSAACLKSRDRGQRAIAVWTLAPLLCFALTAKIIYSRYFVFCLVSALLPAAALLVRLAGLDLGRWRLPAWTSPSFLGVLVAVPGLAFGVPLLLDPPAAPWMDDRRYITDRFQYVESNFAGYGLAPIVDFLRQEAQERPIVVLTRDTTGMPRDGVTAYLLEWPNVHVRFVRESESIEASLERRPDAAYRLAAQGGDLYYVLSDAPNGEQERRFRQLNPGASLVMELPKPGGHSRFQLYGLRWAPRTDDTFLDPPASFDGQISLRGYRLSSTTVRAGESLTLTLFWQAERRPARDFTVYNHLTDAEGTRVAQQDNPPQRGRHPTSRWRPGEAVGDTYELRIGPHVPPGVYELKTGMYVFETLQRLPVTRGGATSDGLVLAHITVNGS
jgi:hypothetical protein